MNFKEAIDALVDNIMSMVSSLIDKAPFDKTYAGVVKSVQGKNVTIVVNGVEHVIKSDNVYSANDFVNVLVPRNNWDRATISEKVDIFNGSAKNLNVYQSPSMVGRPIISRASSATTLAGLIEEVRYSNGCMGSCNITGTAPMPTSANWYNYIWIPHRVGGNYGSPYMDNIYYGTLLLFYMTQDNGTWYSVLYQNSVIKTPKAHT